VQKKKAATRKPRRRATKGARSKSSQGEEMTDKQHEQQTEEHAMDEQTAETHGETITIEAESREADAGEVVNDIRKLKCDMVISKHVAVSIGAGFIPFPFVDFATISAVQIRMLYQLCKIYDVKFSKEAARSILSALIGASIPGVQSTLFASGLKMLPVVGTVAGMFATPTLAAATTYAVGAVFVQHLESGGTLLTFDAKKMKSHFERALRQGKKVATESANS
jgi:uncharacterized protein (DUF697 family)